MCNCCYKLQPVSLPYSCVHYQFPSCEYCKRGIKTLLWLIKSVLAINKFTKGLATMTAGARATNRRTLNRLHAEAIGTQGLNTFCKILGIE
jgi:hypothetical protein